MEQTSIKRSLEDANQKGTGRPTKQAKIYTFFAPAGHTSNTDPVADAHDAGSGCEQEGRTSHPFTGKPQVSSLGRYKNCRGVISTPSPRTNGYVLININGKKHLMHRTVAVAFGLHRRDDQDTVDHIDGNPSNNRLDNLRWASRSEQVRHSYATNKKRASSAPKRSKPVLGRALSSQEWTRYPSTERAARALELFSSNISACCIGKRKRTGEYEFKWAEANEAALLPGEIWRNVEV